MPDWGAHAVECPTKKLALKIHEAILRAPTLKATQKTLDNTLDVTPYDNPAITKFKVTLGTSSELETERQASCRRPSSCSARCTSSRSS